MITLKDIRKSFTNGEETIGKTQRCFFIHSGK